ncbi:MAG: Lipolytic protein family [Solirubrobacterales bacterium]|nr:Lipolytic protein family [Solirubrobacterales bacterium]
MTFGHSYVSGRDPDHDVTPWPDRAGQALGLQLDNRGIGGTESPETLEVVREYKPDPQDTIVIECILNDALRHGRSGLDVWRQSVDAMLTHVTPAVPADRILLVLDPPPRGSDQLTTDGEPFTRTLRRYADAGQEVASRHGVRVLDLAPGWDTDRDISDDGLHPSEAGTQRIADLVSAALGRK